VHRRLSHVRLRARRLLPGRSAARRGRRGGVRRRGLAERAAGRALRGDEPGVHGARRDAAAERGVGRAPPDLRGRAPHGRRGAGRRRATARMPPRAARDGRPGRARHRRALEARRSVRRPAQDRRGFPSLRPPRGVLNGEPTMILDPRVMPTRDVYFFLISAVVPRPIAFVSTVSAAGATNLAPFSYFNAIASVPPLITISINDRADDPKDTLRNIRETREFVGNVVSEPLLDAMVRTSGEWPRATSEFGPSGLTPGPSERVRAPYVAESPLQLECTLYREIPLGNTFLVVGEVILARVRDEVLTEGRVDPAKLAPVGRLGGELYAPLGPILRRPRPKVARAAPLGQIVRGRRPKVARDARALAG